MRQPMVPGNSNTSCGVCDGVVIAHPTPHGDFSRWVEEVLGDPPPAAAGVGGPRAGQPLTTPTGISLATLRHSPAAAAAATT